MKTTIVYIITLLVIVNGYSQLNSEDETFYYEDIEFETNDFDRSMSYAENTYTPITTYKGISYFIWLDTTRRPKIGKIENSKVTSIDFLDKDQKDIYTVRDDGHHKFSIGVDKEGYIHVVGDMHNYGTPSSFNTIHYPERYRPTNVTGVDKNIKTRNNLDNFIMYWVSEKPEDITSFKFTGGDKEKAIPGFGFSYSAFHSDMNGELYIRHRARIAYIGHYDGEMGSIAAKYDTKTKTWTELGGLANPKELPRFPNVALDYDPLYKSIFWENNGISTGKNKKIRNWYQGFTGDMTFDFNNRMHLSTSINNNNDKEFMTDVLYTYSDDQGKSFHRADGNSVKAPVRVESGPNQGSIVSSESESIYGYHLWTSIFCDKEGIPAVNYTKIDKTAKYKLSFGTYKYWDKKSNNWTKEIQNPIGGFHSHKNIVDANGIISFVTVDTRGKIIRDFGLNPYVSNKDVGSFIGANFYGIDQRGIREKNVIRGFYYNKNGGSLQIRALKGVPNLTPISKEWKTSLLGDVTGETGMFHDIYQLKSTGIFGEKLSGQYIHQSVKGDFELTARVINVNYISDSSFGGLMVKNNTIEDSSYFGVASTSYEGVKTISKNQLGKFEINQKEGYEPSEWLKITRIGNTLTSYRSDNGKKWMELASREIKMDETVTYGLISGSGNEKGEMSHARIDHVSLTKIK